MLCYEILLLVLNLINSQFSNNKKIINEINKINFIKHHYIWLSIKILLKSLVYYYQILELILMKRTIKTILFQS